ncbi:heavy metal translocating P-type ATPase [Oceanicola sp. 502str15]|uniref:heavy metal translocating P-type ATPase n=1 Tax=Oceanicola sp. 502str15 TaxID=2696061 RepID=UPI0020955A78|nr:heavy metal translocating P-type ATPase [Oceanicola sp. 502str15]MCO6384554.1 cadmium-translocating P-type ATPase [Oceanicola sp. 502str15]
MDGSLERGGLAACPACVALPAMGEITGAMAEKELMLSLPEIHCAACISGVERVLAAQPGVASARVNLTLKRARVEADSTVEAGALVGALTAAGFVAHELDPELLTTTEADRAGRDLLMRLAVAGFAMMNVMLLSVAVWSGAEGATRDLFHWISAAIAFPAVGFAARPFFASAAQALRAGRLNMDVPISLAILLALGTSLYETIHSGAHAYFDAALSLTFFLLAGRYLDFRTRSVARSAAQELAALEVPRAVRLVAGREETVGVAELAAGDLVLVRPGGRMPVDGVIVRGRSELDRALLTGETNPVAAVPGQGVSAGEINLTGPLTVRVTAAGRDTSLHRMADLVAVAESAKTRYTSLADRAAGLYAPGVHILALLAGVGWFVATLDVRVALNIAAAVLIITCPCALGLAVPAVVTAASGRLFRKGLLIKEGTALERLAEVTHVVFDKTGTLTMGTPEPMNLADVPGDAKRAALSLAMGSAHPLAVALTAALRNEGVLPLPVEDVKEMPGLGSEARAGGRRVRLGRAEWVGARTGAETATWLLVGDEPPVAFLFADRLRPGASEVVAGLKAAGCEVELLSGDTPGAVARFAETLGIDSYRASVLPAEKAARIEALQAEGAKVLMVGDGLNDTAALAAAHASISPATALDAARVASDIVLLGESVMPVADAVVTARRAVRRIRENFRIASAYNLIAVPLAVAGLATPLVAALAMSASSITVSLNALRLR